MEITIHRPEELSSSLLLAWHRVMDESPDYANPFLAPEFAAGMDRYRGGAHVAVLHEKRGARRLLPVRAQLPGRRPSHRSRSLRLSGPGAPPGVTWDTQELLRACGLSVFEFDHLVEEQKPFGRHVAGTFASPVIDLKVGEGTYAEWLRGAYPGLAKTTLKKERRLGRDLGEMRFVYDSATRGCCAPSCAGSPPSTAGRDGWTASRGPGSWTWWTISSGSVRSTSTECCPWCTGDRPVAAHFGPTSRTLFAAWFTAYDPELRYYSPRLVALGWPRPQGGRACGSWTWAVGSRSRRLGSRPGSCAWAKGSRPRRPGGHGAPALAQAGAGPAQHGPGPSPAAGSGRPAAEDGRHAAYFGSAGLRRGGPPRR